MVPFGLAPTKWRLIGGLCSLRRCLQYKSRWTVMSQKELHLWSSAVSAGRWPVLLSRVLPSWLKKNSWPFYRRYNKWPPLNYKGLVMCRKSLVHFQPVLFLTLTARGDWCVSGQGLHGREPASSDRHSPPTHWGTARTLYGTKALAVSANRQAIFAVNEGLVPNWNRQAYSKPHFWSKYDSQGEAAHADSWLYHMWKQTADIQPRYELKAR